MPTTRSPSLQAAARARVEHPAQRLVPEHQARLARRRPAVLALDDLDVRPADADGDGLDEHRPVVRVRLGDVLEARGLGLVWFDGDGLHAQAFLHSLRRNAIIEELFGIGRSAF